MDPVEHPRPTRAEIDLAALAGNLRRMKALVGRGVRIMAVVKADAYGHGAVRCARKLEEEGVDWFGVAIPEEGAELRHAGITRPILCLGSIWPGQEQMVVEDQVTPVLFSERVARSLNSYAKERGRTLDVHIKIDTGMGRVGVRWDRVGGVISLLSELSNLRVSGLMTHFASAEDHAQDLFTATQIERFDGVVRQFRDAGHEPEYLDLANSPGTIAHPESRGNMVRLGGALFGLLDDIMHPDAERPKLQAVMSLRSRIANIKDIPARETLGYGRTFETKRDSRIALVPVGYADGYPRALGNKGEACLRGTTAPIVGRVSMDWTLLDVTDIPEASVDDEVTLIGTDGESSVSAAGIAQLVGTIGYEITCGIGPRVPRVFI
jgi:alanine racemase